jgi:hypothetical protein
VRPYLSNCRGIDSASPFPYLYFEWFSIKRKSEIIGMVEKGDGRRRDDPTPEEIQEECKRIRKRWASGERIMRRSRWKKQPWRLPEVHHAEGDEETPPHNDDSE